jgi:hypothetical protein
MIDVGQDLRGLGVLHDLADLAFQELGRRIVGFLARRDVAEGGPELEPTLLPLPLEDPATLLVGHVEDRAVLDREGMAIRSRPHRAAGLVDPGLQLLLTLRRQRGIVGRHRVVGRALEDGEVLCRLGDDRRRLDAGRARANLGDALAAEIDAFVGPEPRVIPLTLERLEAGNFRHVGRRQTPHGSDQELGLEFLASLGRDRPTVGGLVVGGAGDAGVEMDVALQVQLVGDEVHIAQDFGLLRVALGPFPLLEQFIRELEAVGMALTVATRARIAVPIPGSTDAIGSFEDGGIESKPIAQAVELVHAREAGADDDGVEVGCGAASGCRAILCCAGHLFSI